VKVGDGGATGRTLALKVVLGVSQGDLTFEFEQLEKAAAAGAPVVSVVPGSLRYFPQCKGGGYLMNEVLQPFEGPNLRPLSPASITAAWVALHHLHAKGFAHGDARLPNLMLRRNSSSNSSSSTTQGGMVSTLPPPPPTPVWIDLRNSHGEGGSGSGSGSTSASTSVNRRREEEERQRYDACPVTSTSTTLMTCPCPTCLPGTSVPVAPCPSPCSPTRAPPSLPTRALARTRATGTAVPLPWTWMT